jgi:hypothetical protein
MSNESYRPHHKSVYGFNRVIGINSHNIYTIDKHVMSEDHLFIGPADKKEFFNLMELKSKIIVIDDYETNSRGFADVVYDKTLDQIIGITDTTGEFRSYRADIDLSYDKKNPCVCIFTGDHNFMKSIDKNTKIELVYAENKTVLSLFITNPNITSQQ